MSNYLFERMIADQQERQLQQVLSCNERSGRFGLELTEAEAAKLMLKRKQSLRENRRVEFGESVLPLLIEAFCDSPYINGDEYAEILGDLQEIFFLYKNESLDELSDEELIAFMREQYDEICCGSLPYLAETCLERFARAVRAGYGGFRASGGRGEYGNLCEEQRWDRDLYLAALADLND